MILPRFYPVLLDAAMVARLANGRAAAAVALQGRCGRHSRADRSLAGHLYPARRAACGVNDHWQAALDQGADFIHLGQDDLDTAAIARAGVRLGRSTHDRAELDRALALQPAYIALGPIWPTLLKQMRGHPQGLHKLTRWKSRIGQIPLVAIGGLTPARLPEVFAAGADVAAVVTDLVAAPDPEAQTRLWLQATGGATA